MGGYVEAFLLRNAVARRLAGRMRDETGTDFFEWVDHLVLTPDHGDALRAAGFREEKVDAPPGAAAAAGLARSNSRGLKPYNLRGGSGSSCMEPEVWGKCGPRPARALHFIDAPGAALPALSRIT